MIRIEKQFSSSVNQRVTGSSPVGGAKRIKALQQCEAFFVFYRSNLRQKGYFVRGFNSL